MSKTKQTTATTFYALGHTHTTGRGFFALFVFVGVFFVVFVVVVVFDYGLFLLSSICDSCRGPKFASQH